MATVDDTLSSMVAGGISFPLKLQLSDGEVLSQKILDISMSKDKRYIKVVTEYIIDTESVSSLVKQEQFIQQANSIRSLFSKQIDFKKAEAFCKKVTSMLISGMIEFQTDPHGQRYVNIAQGKGQKGFFSVLLEHMTPQKLKELHDKEGLRHFKKILKENVRHLGKVLNNKSLGVTLHRLIKKM